MGKLNPQRIAAIAIVVLLILAAVRFFQPIAAISPQVKQIPAIPSQLVSLPWPSYGQGALGAEGFGMLSTSGSQTPAPIASIAKVITALAVLKQKPLSLGDQGPAITIGPDDAASYNYYYSNDGSVSKVELGETITEYQALQAMLLPSANNMADTLARWAFGSIDNYVVYANKMVKDMGLGQTTIAGASGFSDQTLSTATDLVGLGQTGLKNPVFADIVAQQEATIPVAGVVHNINWLLGDSGVIGVKTGNTDQAGGCYLFAAKRAIQGQNITLVGALLSAPTLNISISDAKQLLGSIDGNFSSEGVVTKGQIVGSYQMSWGQKVNASATQNYSLLRWKGAAIAAAATLNKVQGSKNKSQTVGKIKISSGDQQAEIPIVLDNNIKPPFIWRFFRN